MKNLIVILKSLYLLCSLFKNSEGLKEAFESIEQISEYYKDYQSNQKEKTLPQKGKISTPTILPSKVRPPLVIDLD
jgi:hypothetical protein